MKTNYLEHLAWFEYSIKPHVITPHSHKTTCWYAYINRPIRPYEVIKEANREKEDTPVILSHPRKRQRIEVDSPFLTTMEEVEESTVDIEELDMGCSRADIDSQESIHKQQENKYSIDEQAILSILCNTFHMKYLVPNQLNAILSTLADDNILLILPRGIHRNICYQLPASMRINGQLTIVIVPNALCLSQHDSTYNIPTLFITDTHKYHHHHWISIDDLKEVADTIIKGQSSLKLLYICYRDFLKCRLSVDRLYQHGNLIRFVIEEAHCISQWGDDFHSGYLHMTETLKTIYPLVPIMAVTAAFNERVQTDIIHSLKLQSDCRVYKKSILLGLE
ncbi:hypothetical protein BDB01DRAFT_717127 [Pilobolus umbonatus]|nr:hypothetical protein BDB01DRAFT_717127 [Pilobolus umbonatus]